MLVVNGEALSVCSIFMATQVVYKFKKNVAFVTGKLFFGFIFNDLNDFVCYFNEMCNDVKV